MGMTKDAIISAIDEDEEPIVMRKIELLDGDAMLDEFYKDWSLTIEGLNTDNACLMEYASELGKYLALGSTVRFYKVSGKAMNEHYGLTDSNAYNDDLTIVIMMQKDMRPLDKESFGRLCIARFSWGGRWFTDIVDNNERKQKEIDAEKDAEDKEE